MKIIRLASIFIILSMLLGIGVSAEEASNWYIVKMGKSAPLFPPDAQEISNLGGIFIDRKASENGEKKLYLTFDVGYENGNVSRILDVLNKENVTGAFFILSNIISKNPDLVIRMAEEGHLVCNHTYNHKDMTLLSDSDVILNLKRLEDKYREVTGFEMEKLFRFPEGRYNARVLKLLQDNGYRSVFWSMAYADWDNAKQIDKNTAMQKLLSTTHDGAIILLHPTSSTNAEILGDLIREWKSLGYTFASLKEI